MQVILLCIKYQKDMISDFLHFNRHQPKIYGPVTMFPAADDNYGQDSCSLLCLQCQPPVIAMATASGKIYHCIALESEESDDAEEVFFVPLHFSIKTLCFNIINCFLTSYLLGSHGNFIVTLMR